MCVLGGISNRSAGGVLFVHVKCMVRSKNNMIYSNFWPTHLPHWFLLNYRFVKGCDKQNVILTCTLALFCDLVIYNFLESRGAAAKIQKKMHELENAKHCCVFGPGRHTSEENTSIYYTFLSSLSNYIRKNSL